MRPVLFERLSAAAPGTVTLVCAPAGSGKTVLLRSWAAGLEEAVAWVTVERGERDSQRFCLHLIDALAAVVCMHVCVGSPKMPPLKAVHRPKVTLFPVRQQMCLQTKNAACLRPARCVQLCMHQRELASTGRESQD